MSELCALNDIAENVCLVLKAPLLCSSLVERKHADIKYNVKMIVYYIFQTFLITDIYILQ